MSRTLVIGDIHGCMRHLDALLQSISPATNDHLIFLGDYIDRGPDSAGVLRTIISLTRTHHVTAILGNHEEMMLAARASQLPDAPRESQGSLHDKLSDWLRNGGDATLKSYAGVRGTLRDVPPEHWQFLQTALVDYLETDSHIFVHANAYPDVAMPEQPDYMLRWERCDAIAPHQSGKIIVCGHTPQTSGKPMNRGYAICLDTNACRSGPLTCLDTVSGRVWQAFEDGHVERAHISDFANDDT